VADGITTHYNVHQARFLFDSAQQGTRSIRLHIYEGNATEQPGAEVAGSPYSISVSQSELYPVWKTLDLSGVSALQNRTANFWFWLEVTSPDTMERYPQIMGDAQVWGDSHFFIYNGTYAQPSAFDYLIRAMVEPSVGVEDNPIELAPGNFELTQNYPNPFNPVTTICFNLPFSTPVTLKVYNIMGQEVTTLIDQKLPAGTHSVEFNAMTLPSGIYFYQIEAAGFKDMKKMVLLK
jgi:hypothetical protein